MTEHASRIPPPGEDLEFARHTGTGTVHILAWIPDPDWRDVQGAKGCVSVAHLTPEQVGDLVVNRRTMLCGQAFSFGDYGHRAKPVEVFADEDICMSCVRALGDQSSRAFEHPQPGAFSPGQE
jgi:hypothetical protein